MWILEIADRATGSLQLCIAVLVTPTRLSTAIHRRASFLEVIDTTYKLVVFVVIGPLRR